VSLINVEALIAANHPIRSIKRMCDEVLPTMMAPPTVVHETCAWRPNAGRQISDLVVLKFEPIKGRRGGGGLAGGGRENAGKTAGEATSC
jgi:hypothetical protein